MKAAFPRESPSVGEVANELLQSTWNVALGPAGAAQPVTGLEGLLPLGGELALCVLNSIGDAVVCTDLSGNITFVNAAAEQLTGWTMEEASGKAGADVLRMLDSKNRQPIANPMKLAIETNQLGHLPLDTVLVRRDGTTVQVEDSAAPIHGKNGELTGAVIVLRDVSQSRTLVLQMAHSAHHDFLTSLPNRVLLNDRISHAIARSSRQGKKLAVIFLDLDGFKHINDSLGHRVGDSLLQSVSRRLLECVRGGDTVSRLGGDEFVVLLNEVEGTEDAATAATRMLRAVSAVHTIDNHELQVTTSIGVSFYPADGIDAETLIMNADTAMYQAKASGRQRFQFYEPTMNIRAAERQILELALRGALAGSQLKLQYQPKINLATQTVVGAEALLRWTHPIRGAVAPGEFIPVAEACGVIQPIGAWVLREACIQAQAWRGAGLPPITMAVNVSAVEFRDESYVENLMAILHETGLDPNALELELTESVMMNRVDSTIAILRSLRNKGVKVVVDDFGTGYSSLSYLRNFPVTALKIDQSFVRRIGADGEDSTMVTAVIGMARNLNLRVVAEGVETHEQLRFLRHHKCDDAQGYYFGWPVVPLQFASLLQGKGRRLPRTVASGGSHLPGGL